MAKFTTRQARKARQRRIAQPVLFALLLQALFATGTMAGGGTNGGSWVTLCLGTSGITELVYLGDEQPTNTHAQEEQCVFSSGALAAPSTAGFTAFAVQQNLEDLNNYLSPRSELARSVQARAPPVHLS
jgi:hypothetical protein